MNAFKLRLWTCLLLLCYHHIHAFSLELPVSVRSSVNVAEVYHKYTDLPEGKHPNERISVDVVVQEIKQISPRLVFLRAQDANIKNQNDEETEIVELLLRERDNFLNSTEIERITKAVTDDGPKSSSTILHCHAFPERLSFFDGPSCFPHLHPPPAQPICLHVVAANATLGSGEFLPIRPTEKAQNTIQQKPTTMLEVFQQQPKKRTNPSRGGGGNRNRGSIFAQWAMEKFGLTTADSNILDIAGGSGQLAFQLGVRRGFNVTVVDPRELRLASDQQRTLLYHRTTGLRILPEGRDPSLPLADYGHHFCELPPVVTNNNTNNERTFLVGGGAHVKHLQMYFDPQFSNSNNAIWNDCSVVLGMHPDEATEDLVDLALAHDKPFAVVPCCVFWKRDPHRRTPSGKQVRTWEQFCDYLAAKDNERIQTTTLPFQGRNTVLYSMGNKRQK